MARVQYLNIFQFHKNVIISLISFWIEEARLEMVSKAFFLILKETNGRFLLQNDQKIADVALNATCCCQITFFLPLNNF